MRTLFLILFLLGTNHSSATLGENANSIDRDIQAHHGSAKNQTAKPKYTVLETHSDQGQTIREFLGNNGTVFAVAWQGSTHPDIAALLGSYYQETVKAHAESQKNLVGRKSVSRTETKNVVFKVFGHMGDLHGLAFCPPLLPAGVSEKDLQ